MPYESFACAHHLQIRGLAQDRQSGAWRYVVHVRRESPAPAAALKPPRASAAGPSATSTESYTVRRSLGDFKRLHDAMAPLMGRALPKLPVDSLFSFLVGETQAALLKKRAALEAVLAAIDAHPAASDAPEYLEFLANLDAYAQVSRGPQSPAMSSRSSFSCYSDDGLASTPLGHAALSSSANALRRAYFQQQRLLLQQHESSPNLLAVEAANAGSARRPRRRSLEAGGRDGVENFIEFSHFSMT